MPTNEGLPSRWSMELLLAVGLVTALGTYFAVRSAVVGPIIDGDALRDLFAALDIARNGTFYAYGPAVAGTSLQLGPAYYYFLAFPLLVWDSAQAIPWWVAFWQIATIILLFDTARRFFSMGTAIVATAVFFFSNICFRIDYPLMHSDLSPILGLLLVRSPAQLQDGRSWAIVTAFLWSSVALHFHLLNLTLFPMILGLLLVGRPPVAWYHLLVAGIVALSPFLPIVCATGSLSEAATAASGVVPVALIVIAIWSLPPIRSLRSTALLLVASGWLYLVCIELVGAVNGHPAFRLFNIIFPLNPFDWEVGVGQNKSKLWFLVPFPDSLLIWSLAAYGFTTCLLPRLRMAWRNDADARASRLLLLGLWVASTAPVAVAAYILSLGERRYLSSSWTCVTLCAALGLERVWHRYRGGSFVRFTAAHPPVLWGTALVTPVAWLVLAGWQTPARISPVQRSRFLFRCGENWYPHRTSPPLR